MRSRSAILEACAQLIAEEGFPGVTIEAVAQRSGTAKTTIYRHWADRDALLVDAFGLRSEPVDEAPDTGSLREDLVAVMSALAVSLRDTERCAILRSLADSATRHPELSQLHISYVAECRRPLTEALGRAVERGSLPSDLDRDEAVSMLAGPLFYRAMVSWQPIDDGFVAGVVDSLLAAVGARAAT
ncbi:MAG: TetR/AcrR family transcriptional regulator [Thermoleophilia bacterium]